MNKIEIFDRNFAAKGVSAIGNIDPKFDYLTLETTEIVVPKILQVAKGYYLSVTDNYNVHLYDGIVKKFAFEKGKTIIEAIPLTSLLDIAVRITTTLGTATAAETWVKGVIDAALVTNADTLQNVTGLSVVADTATTGFALILDDAVNNIYDVALKLFNVCRVVISGTLAPNSIVFTIAIPSSTVRKIEADTNNVIESNFDFEDTLSLANKATIFDSTHSEMFYKHSDGTVNQTNSDRITPVIFVVKEITYTASTELPTFLAAATAKAVELLNKADYQNCISLKVKTTDKIINKSAMEIGGVFDIVHKGVAYRTIYTGYEIQGDICTLIFGKVRTELTKKLKMDRRNA